MQKNHAISLLVALVLILPVSVFAVVNWMEKKWRALPVYTGSTETISQFRLTDQYGNTRTGHEWQGKIVVANLFFSHCPVICPKMVRNIEKVQTAFPGDSRLLFASFSTDPGRDSVERLKAFATKFGIAGNWHLLTGNKTSIYRLAHQGFSLAADVGGKDQFIHSDKLVLLDTQRRIRGYYSGTAEKDMQQLITDIKKLHDEN
jgi:protein SCO1/2